MENTMIDTPQGEQQEKKKITLKGVTESQKKKLLTSGATGIVGILGGAGFMYAFTPADKDVDGNVTEPTLTVDPIDENDPVVEEPIAIYTEAPFATTINDSMSFSDAFATARKELGQGGFFEWKGNTYNTYYKEEWDSMTESEQKQFFDSVDQNTVEITVVVIEPEPVIIPEPIDEPTVITYEITEEDYVTVDVNQDGKADIASVNANANDIPDIVIDLDADGNMDKLILDVDPEKGFTGNEVVIDLDEFDASDSNDIADVNDNSGNDHDDAFDSDFNDDINTDTTF